MIERSVSTRPQLPSNRKLGWFFCVLFIAIASYLHFKKLETFVTPTATMAIIFAIVATTAPRLLTPLNRFWYGLGMLLGKIVSPLVLGIIFFVLITPIALFTRLLGRDELRLKKRFLESYWVVRSPPGPPSDSFKNQY